MDRIYLSPPHMEGDELKNVIDAFNTNWIAPLGPHVDAFEKEVSSYVNVGSAAALSSGTAAIHLALIYLGVKENDIVLCSSLTFSASCNPILYQKAQPVFIDSEPDSWNMSPIALEKALSDFKKENKLPKAVIIVNIYGQSADMDSLNEICKSYNVPVIEDAAESLGAKYKGKQSGGFGTFAAFSFNGNKIITTGGGGMLVSDNKEAISKCRFWSTQARDKAKYYQHSELGYNYRMSNVLAAIGRGQLEKLDFKIKRKKEIYNTYKNEFSSISQMNMMPIPKWSEPNYWLSVVTIDKCFNVNAEKIVDALELENIEARLVWKPMHLQPLYSKYKYYPHEKGESDKIFETGLCLPSGSSLTEGQQERIIKLIKKCVR